MDFMIGLVKLCPFKKNISVFKEDYDTAFVPIVFNRLVYI